MRYEILTSKGNLDVLYDYDISLNYSIDDILDISKRATNWSKTIVLPGTPNNNKFFEHIYEVNIDKITFNPSIQIPISLRVGTNEVMKGYMQLLTISNTNREVSYEVALYGSLKNIFNKIGDNFLCALDLSEFNHTRTQQSVIDSWTYNVVTNGNVINYAEPGTGYVYPYIINGQHQDIWSNMYLTDMDPAVYVKTIFDKIMTFSGYTYKSNFLNSQYFKKLIIPYTKDALQMTDEEFEKRSLIVGTDANQTFTNLTPIQQRGSEWFYNDVYNYKINLTRESGTVNDSTGEITFNDPSNQYTPHKFTCANDGRYDINFVGHPVTKIENYIFKDIEYKSGEFEYRYQMILLRTDGSSVVLDSSVDPADPNDIYGVQTYGLSDGVHSSPWYDIDTPLYMTMSASNIALSTGDRVIIRLGWRYPSAVKWKGLNDSAQLASLVMKQSLDGDFTKFSVEPASPEISAVAPIDMNRVLDCSIKMKEWLLDIVKMFNLIIADDPDSENSVIIEPRDDYYRSKQKVLDWDAERILDNDSIVKLTPMSELDAKTYKYTYTADDDFYNKQYTTETDRVFGDYSLNVINDFSDKTNETKVMFSPTICASGPIDSRVAPFFVDYANELYSPKKVRPRILFYGGLQDMYGGSVLNFKDYPEQNIAYGHVLTQYPYCGMWEYPNSGANSLEFGKASKLYHNPFSIPNQTLYEKFHKNTLQQITDVNSMLLECTVKLTPSFIAEFDFRDIVFLNGSYWRFNLIKDYNPINSDKLTTVVLYKIINMDIQSKFNVSVPISNGGCPDDIVVKIPNKGGKKTKPYFWSENGAINENCCKLLGGVWINGICQYGKEVGPLNPDGGIFGLAPNTGVIDGLVSDVSGIITVGGTDVLPTLHPNGPYVMNMNGTTRVPGKVTTLGDGNIIPGAGTTTSIIGNANTINPNVKNTIVVGDGISVKESNSIYLGNVKISDKGIITPIGNVIIDGGQDEIFNFNKRNPVEVIDGTIDSVRNPGGVSYARPIIDGNIYE